RVSSWPVARTKEQPVETNIDVAGLVGEWAGSYLLWLGPDEPVRESETAGTVTAAAAGQFLVLTYTWAASGKPHDGVLIARVADAPGAVEMDWVDAFHPAGKFMTVEGQSAAGGGLRATTKWSAGEGPAWGWRIDLSSAGSDDLVVQTYIATPTGEE